LADRISQALQQRGWEPQIRPIEASESLKAIETIYPLYAEMLAAGMRRQSLAVAVGGGTVGDAIGFLAATYLRGIAWVNVPTTLLAQVDSSLGGKTGINHKEGKNLIGAFHQPRSILCDTQLLGELPEREIISGLGEMLKYGLIADADFWVRLCTEAARLRQGNSAYLSEAIAHSLKIKAHYVQQDEFDLTGIRAALNFGHTFAHGIEAAVGYGSLRHGEAVLLGMELAILLSLEEKVLPESLGKTWLQSLQKISSISLQDCLKNLNLSKMIDAMKKDKKNENSSIRILLIKDHGNLSPRDFSVIYINNFLKSLL
jgi:3-dehydroquinate synthase